MKTRLILSEDTLKAGITGEDRFNVNAHHVTPTEVAGAHAIVIMIDGRVEVVKAKNFGTSAEIVGGASIKAPDQIVIYPAQNGGFVVRERGSEVGRIVDIIAACSDLTGLLEAVERYYQREAVVSGDVDAKDDDPDFAEVGEERTATDGAADADGNGGDFYYVLVSGPESDPEKNVTVFYDEDAMKRAMELVWSAGGKAWARPARLI